MSESSAKPEKLKTRERESALVLRLDEVRPMTPVPAARKLPQVPARPVRKTRVTYKSEKMANLAAKTKGGFSGTWLAFFLMVIVPTAIGFCYFAFFATPQYVSEFRFSVRPAEGAPIAQSGAAALALSNSFIVSDYIESRDVVDALQNTVDLRAMYTRDTIDPISRLGEDVSVEKLVKYWRKRITTSFDITTGINTVEVAAFNPDDALKIASALRQLCENLVNSISEKARHTQLDYARQELEVAEKRMKDVRAQETELRTGQRSLDARKEAEGKIELQGKLRASLAELESRYASLGSYMDAKSPRLAVIKSQIDATRAQISDMQNRVSSTQGAEGDDDELADAALVSRYDEIKTDLDIATKLYQSALTSFEAARMLANNNHIYLATYVQPSLAQIASYPLVFGDTVLLFLSACGVWIVLTLVYYSIRDHA
ncbi:hypothetical protein ACLE20_10045 [Rhizobium sp. YIM 134829]|uniref:hypothetical protein n=1 Tax=Rhizobium sp. YIM 134829 TaxID=3390453 RepID=UPI00397DA51E